MSSQLKVSQSRMKTWRKCRQAHHFRYVEKIESKKKGRPLVFGKVIHQLLEAYQDGDDPWEKLRDIEKSMGSLFIQEAEMYGNIIQDLGFILADYLAYYPENSLKYFRLNKKASEHVLEMEILSGEAVIIAKLDGLAATPNKLRWLVERKSYSQIPHVDERWRNLQSSLYLKMIEELGIMKVEGLCWDYIWSKPPSPLPILKSGKLSERNTNTLPSKIESMLIEHGMKMTPRLRTLGSEGIKKWFTRIFTPARRDVIEAVFDDFIIDTAMIMEYGEKSRTKTIDRHCNWCEYEPLCRGEFSGSDVDYIKEKNFQARTRDDDPKGDEPTE